MNAAKIVRRSSRYTISAVVAAGIMVLLILSPSDASAANPQPLWQTPLDVQAGSGAGELDHPIGIATDPNTGHVFVGDSGNSRVSEFDSFGQFVKAWGWGVADGADELQTCGPGATPPTENCQEAAKGGKPGQFERGIGDLSPLGGIAVDADGNVYVGDLGNYRVQKFDSDGNFLLMLGGGVNQGPLHPGNLCTAAFIAEGDTCGAGNAGEANGEFSIANFSFPYIATGPSGTVFVGDKGRIQEFGANGSFKSQIKLDPALASEEVLNLAVDDAGNLAFVLGSHPTGVASSPEIRRLNSAGVDIGSIQVPGAPSTLAFDNAGHLFVGLEFESGQRREIVEFASDGSAIIPVGEGFAKSTGSAGNDTGMVLRGLATNIVTAEGATNVYVVGTSASSMAAVTAYGPAPDKWPAPKLAPTIVSQFASSVDSVSAAVKSEINPHFWADTAYFVEYGTGRCSEGECTSTQPAPPGGLLGAGLVDAVVATKSILLTGLSPGTTYYYRFVSQSGGGGPAVGVGPGFEEASFTTPTLPVPGNVNCPNQRFRVGAAAGLPDCRAYEMVTPIEKNNTDIVSLINLNSNPATLNQSAVSGEKIAYTTSQGFGDSQGTPYVSQYIASRGTEGWSSHGISPPQGIAPTEPGTRIDIEFRDFSPDLCTGVLLHTTDSPLALGAKEGTFNFYRRQNCGEESYEALMPEWVNAEGMSADGRCAVYGWRGPEGKSSPVLFETCEGQQRQVSVLPNGVNTTGSAGTPVAGEVPRAGTNAGAVSNDGKRVYWTSGSGDLFLRLNSDSKPSKIVTGECTEPERACSILVAKGAHYWAASADGSKAVYSVRGPFTPEMVDLYQFDLATRTSTLIAGGIAVDRTLSPVLGVTEDADHVFFISRKVLSRENAENLTPTEGEPNIYYFDGNASGDDRYRFVGTLSATDMLSGAETARKLSPLHTETYKNTSRVTPDGRHLVFMSTARLTGYDNTDLNSGLANAEIFLYDSTADGGAGRLRCLSCNPKGQRPAGRNIPVEGGPSGSWGAALLPTPETELYAPRVISEDGTRVFFNSFEALVSRDTNGKADVYEWSRLGSNGCEEGGSGFSQANSGCLSLISSGESPTDSVFVDASPDGHDVFLTTASSLVPQDPGLIDIYDAREGGGYPPPPGRAPVCEGEACQSPLAPPNDPTPGSLTFKGAGNIREGRSSRCAKGKRSVKGRCVRKKKVRHGKTGNRPAQQANHKGRVSR